MTGLYIQSIMQTRDCKFRARLAIWNDNKAAIASPFGFVAPLMFCNHGSRWWEDGNGSTAPLGQDAI